MPLHERDTVRQQLEDSVFAGHDMTSSVPKYRFPPNETLSRDAGDVVHFKFNV
jgi:glutamate decarboxylase